MRYTDRRQSTPASALTNGEEWVLCGTCGSRHAPLAVRLDRARQLAQATPNGTGGEWDEDGRENPRVWVALLFVAAALSILLLILLIIGAANARPVGY